jgi:hypothetical protein
MGPDHAHAPATHTALFVLGTGIDTNDTMRVFVPERLAVLGLLCTERSAEVRDILSLAS